MWVTDLLALYDWLSRRITAKVDVLWCRWKDARIFLRKPNWRIDILGRMQPKHGSGFPKWNKVRSIEGEREKDREKKTEN